MYVFQIPEGEFMNNSGAGSNLSKRGGNYVISGILLIPVRLYGYTVAIGGINKVRLCTEIRK